MVGVTVFNGHAAEPCQTLCLRAIPSRSMYRLSVKNTAVACASGARTILHHSHTRGNRLHNAGRLLGSPNGAQNVVPPQNHNNTVTSSTKKKKNKTILSSNQPKHELFMKKLHDIVLKLHDIVLKERETTLLLIS